MKDQLQTIREFIESVHEGEWAPYAGRYEALTALSELEAIAVEQEPILIVQHGEICYKSQDDDQSYGMWCPVTPDAEHGLRNGTQLYAAPVAQQPQYEAGDMASAHNDGFRAGVASVTQQAEAVCDDFRDRLVAISQAIADQGDRAAQAMIREVLAAPQQSEAVPADQSKWCAYVAGMIGCYLGEDDDSAKVKAIAGIIERRMWASAHQPLKIAAWRGVHVEGDYLYYDEFPEELTAEQRRQLHLKPLYEGAAQQAETAQYTRADLDRAYSAGLVEGERLAIQQAAALKGKQWLQEY